VTLTVGSEPAGLFAASAWAPSVPAPPMTPRERTATAVTRRVCRTGPPTAQRPSPTRGYA
jgi:hypothetical protein